MNKSIMKVNSWISIILAIAIMLITSIYLVNVISVPSRPNSWDDLGKFFAVCGAVIIYIMNTPLIITGLFTLKYIKKNKFYKTCMTFNIIGIILFCAFISLFIIRDELGVFADYYNGNVNVGLKTILAVVLFVLFVLPLIINSILLYKDKNNLESKALFNKFRVLIIVLVIIAIVLAGYYLIRFLIIGVNTIKVTDNNTYTYAEFKSELIKRKLVYNLPEDMMKLAGREDIFALDSNSKYGYEFSNGTYTDSYLLSVDTTRKFPLFVYESYTSLIKKSEKTASYYTIGPEDWYITWNIYYVNGTIYAAIGDESEYGSMWSTSLSRTRYGVVVSEEDKITVYNSQGNYFVKGGCVVDTSSGMQRSSFPTTKDIYGSGCMKIRVVDRVDAETLDKIAKELSPRYWDEYRANN